MSSLPSQPTPLRRIASRAVASPLYLAVLAIYPVLFVAVQNPGQTATFSVLKALGAAAGAAVLLLAVLRLLICRTWRSAALITAFACSLFWTYSLAFQTFFFDAESEPLHGELESAHLRLSMMWSIAIALFAWWARKLDQHKVERITSGLNVAAAVLATSLLVAFGSVRDAQRTEMVSSPTSTGSAPAAQLPDIYYVILDGYARADILQRHYGADNALVGELAARDFFVAPESTSNYYWTFLSLASSLNLDYVQNLIPDALKPTSVDRSAPYGLIRENAAAKFLRDRGYRFVQVNSTWGATLSNEFADREVVCGDVQDEFSRTLIDMSWLGVMNEEVSVNLAQCHLQQFAALGRLGGEAGPKFVFAHFILPHHPYLFDRNGRVLGDATLSNQFQFQKRLWEDKAGYLEQLQFVNQRILGTIDEILASSQRPPIIIIQSDHGPNLRNDMTLEQQQSVRFPNLAAFHLPGAPAGLIPPDVTPVNQFRRIFNHYFSSDFAILPDRRYYSDYRSPYALSEVPAERFGPEQDASQGALISQNGPVAAPRSFDK